MKKGFLPIDQQRSSTSQNLRLNRKTAIKAAISLSLSLSILMVVTSVIIISFDKSSTSTPLNFISIKVLASFVFNVILLYYLFLVQFKYISKYSQQHHRRNPTILIVSLIIVLILSPLFSRIQWRWFSSDQPDGVFLAVHLVKDMVILFISFLYTSIVFLFNKNQEKVLENKNLEIENLQNRYNMLKNQVDPHFLFNSLNTLNGLIATDVDRAHKYVNHLSQTFRYSMQDHQMVRVKDELRFTKSYIYLMQIRYGDALTAVIDIAPECMSQCVVPFALQALIENAIKHNAFSDKNPLKICIKSNGQESIIVKNNVRPKRSREKSGLGLGNLNERYFLMFEKTIEVSHDTDQFVVEIPLITMSKPE